MSKALEDLPFRLRNMANMTDKRRPPDPNNDLRLAADLIERQAAEIERLYCGFALDFAATTLRDQAQ